MKKVLAVVLGVVLLAAACNNNSPVPTDNTAQPETQAPVNNDTNTGAEVDVDVVVPPTPAVVKISMTAKGFEPSKVSVKKGTTVTFVNNDSISHWPASAPHPTHTIYPQLDSKTGIAAGASWSFTFDKVGEWKFHDHLTPTMFGSVTVTE